MHFDLSSKKDEIAKYNEKMNQPEFWDDPEKAQIVMQKANDVKTTVATYEELQGKTEELEILLQMVEDSSDGELEKELKQKLDETEKEIEEFRLDLMLDGEYDKNSAILSLHPGAGGTESQDWAEMLLRMYLRWAEKKSYKVKTLDYQDGEEAGIKSVSLLIEGSNAYGYLKAEKGVHRLVRISPFDSSGRRHTSFASVDVTPKIDDDVTVDINPEDLRIDTYRASGAGGQHVNTTDSAIRITHEPTGIIVQCQNERSQHKNKETAMKMLYGKLIELKEREHADRIEDLKGEYGQIAWGSQIRSYVFHPYNMIKDHRTQVEVGNVQSVMDGDLDPFIHAYLRQKMSGGEEKSE
ncbi:MAG TPA: peptide chain release factor 2, partial [Eubacteriaceae bacterium]|nr:peptide chain release factor 2 [Eubacteriaceae bacterium]